MDLLPASGRPPAPNVVSAVIEAFRGGAVIRPIDPIAPEAVFEFCMPAFAEPIRIDYATLSESPKATLDSLLAFVFQDTSIGVRECGPISGGKLVLEFRSPLQFRPWELLLYPDHEGKQHYLFASFMHEVSKYLPQRLSDVSALEETPLSASEHDWLLALPSRFVDPRPPWVKFLTQWKAVRENKAMQAMFSGRL